MQRPGTTTDHVANLLCFVGQLSDLRGDLPASLTTCTAQSIVGGNLRKHFDLYLVHEGSPFFPLCPTRKIVHGGRVFPPFRPLRCRMGLDRRFLHGRFLFPSCHRQRFSCLGLCDGFIGPTSRFFRCGLFSFTPGLSRDGSSLGVSSTL